jgi:putative membrane protein insertion efficiency factor
MKNESPFDRIGSLLIEAAQELGQWPRMVLVGIVRAYRFFLKPWLGNACRFEPSCSQYALDALQRHGAVVGGSLAGARLLRCHPWCHGGCDPVPDAPPGLFTRLGLVQERKKEPH